MVFANSVDSSEMTHNQNLSCLTFSLSTLHINFIPVNSLLKTKQKTNVMYADIYSTGAKGRHIFFRSRSFASTPFKILEADKF